LTAFYQDLGRDPIGIPEFVIGGSVFFTAWFIGPFLPALVFGVAALFGRNAWNTWRIRRDPRGVRRNREYPTVSEFRSLWAVTVYEFVKMVNGYNLRCEAVGYVRAEGKSGQAAELMARLLKEVYPRLVRIKQMLMSCQTTSDPLRGTESELVKEKIMLHDPIGHHSGKPSGLEWLPIDEEILTCGRVGLKAFEPLLLRDLAVAGGMAEYGDGFDPYAELEKRFGHEFGRKPDEP
jgi:hypothetical protein